MINKHRLLPEPILKAFAAKQFHGEGLAAVLFVDMAGFTSLTETLLQHGKQGTSILNKTLNTLFSPLITAVYARSGWITTFAGDGFTALFPHPDPHQAAAAAYSAACAMQLFIDQAGIRTTSFGRFDIKIKIGLAYGGYSWDILGANNHFTYFYRGAALQGAVAAEQKADQGEIVCHPSVAPYLPDADHASFSSHRLPDLFTAITAPPLPNPPQAAILTNFLMDQVIDLAATAVPGEFRRIISCFLSFDTGCSREELNRFISSLIQLAATYGGYFNKLDFGDKGGIAFILFGAPITFENELERAISMLLALQENSKSNPDLPLWRAGISLGTAYAGFIGAQHRSEYTAIGDVVNLAARLSQQANWGQIWVTAALTEAANRQLRNQYQLEPLGNYRFKGKKDLHQVFQLTGQLNSEQDAAFTGKMVGRNRELIQLSHFADTILDGRFGGLFYLYGEPGIGKSRLMNELLHSYKTSSELRHFICQPEEILRQSLNPFSSFLRRYFQQTTDDTAANKQRFTAVLHELTSYLKNKNTPQATRILTDLERLQPFLGALIGLRWPGSLYEQLEPELRLENSFLACKNLLRAESLRQPLILVIEDLQWLDADSRLLLQELCRNPNQFPFGILCASRFQDDGTPFTLELDQAVPQQQLTINALDEDQFVQLITARLGDEADPQLIQFLKQKTEGNPFFAEQLLLDLREQKIITRGKNGRWQLSAAKAEATPDSIQGVLLARLDRLAAPVKLVVQTAAVLGREFELPILNHILSSETELNNKIAAAFNKRIWRPLNPQRYIFTHSLLRDIAYDMQLPARLETLHSLVATAIEALHSKENPAYYADLAYHYDHAGNFQEAARCYLLAGQDAANRYATEQALFNLNRALEITDSANLEQQYTILRQLVQLHDLTGKRQAQQDALEKMNQLANIMPTANALLYRTQTALLQAAYFEAVSDYEGGLNASLNAVTFAEQLNASHLAAEAHFQWGRLLWRQGDFADGRTHLDQSLALARANKIQKLEADCLRNLGVIAAILGEFALSQAHFEQSRQISITLGDLRGAAGTLNNLGNISGILLDYPAAITSYKEALVLHEEMGNRRGESDALGNLGFVYFSLGDYGQAEPFFSAANQINEAIGDTRAIAFRHNNLGWLMLQKGEVDAARMHASRALATSRLIGSRTLETEARTCLGHICALENNLADARNFYRQSIALWNNTAELQTIEARMGLAELALQENDLPAALAEVNLILPFVKEEKIGTLQQPNRIILTVYKTLQLDNQPQGAALLATAFKQLKQIDSNLSPEQSNSFWQIPWNQQIKSLHEAA